MEMHELIQALRDGGTDCLVSGRTAMNFHGIPRMTYDLDLIPDPSEDNVAKSVRVLLAAGYAPPEEAEAGELAHPARRRELIDRGRGVLRFRNPHMPVGEVDLGLQVLRPYGLMRRRAVVVHIHGVAVPLVSLEDLTVVKEKMGRPEDREDLESLRVLEAVMAGDAAAFGGDPRRTQIEKYRQWPVENRSEWLATGSQLHREAGSGGGAEKALPRGRSSLRRKKIRGLRHTDLS